MGMSKEGQAYKSKHKQRERLWLARSLSPCQQDAQWQRCACARAKKEMVKGPQSSEGESERVGKLTVKESKRRQENRL